MLALATTLALLIPVPAELAPGAVARRWLEAQGLQPDDPGLTMDRVFEERFVHWQLGAFELYVPPDVFQDWARDLAPALDGLVEAQLHWTQWFPASESDEALEALRHLGEWFDDLGPAALRGLEPEPGDDLWETLAPEEDVRAAMATVVAFFRTGGPLGLEREPRVRLVIAPTRKEFVELECVIGWVEKDWRHVYWSDEIVNWTHLDYAGTRVLPLEFPGLHADEDYTESISMHTRSGLAVVQHVVQLAMRTLLEQTFGPRLDGVLAVALANSMVIELYGTVDTRNDGDTKARSVGPQSIFVPGAPSDGILPPANAESRWRQTKGEEHFVPLLRKEQRFGGKKQRGKWAKRSTFLLMTEDESDRYPLVGPFLGRHGNTPPEAFRGDYLDFMRAYRAAFLYWLREESQGSHDASRAAFGRLLTTLALAGEDEGLGATLERVYPDTPLSAEALGEGVLEGRFLVWLEKQR